MALLPDTRPTFSRQRVRHYTGCLPAFASSPEKTRQAVVVEISLGNCSDVDEEGKEIQVKIRSPCQDMTFKVDFACLAPG